MAECDRCGESIAASGEWIEVSHHHPNMTFGSRFCSADCAAAYLADGLDDPPEDRLESGSDSLGA
jgi:hypothetical protein